MNKRTDKMNTGRDGIGRMMLAECAVLKNQWDERTEESEHQ